VRLVALLGLVVLAAACSSSAKKSDAPASSTSTTVPGCSPARPAPAKQESYTYKGRTYRLALPADYDGTTERPMLVLFHGFASSPVAIDADTNLEQLGPQRGYIVVTPEGSGNPKSWNFLPDSADHKFANALVGELTTTLCVDPARVFAAGHSAGSAFTGFDACQKPYRYAGIAMVEATIPSTCPANETYSVLSVHGDADPVVLYNGGKGVGQTVPIPPVRETVAALAKRDGCARTATRTEPATGVTRDEYEHCKNGRKVALLTIKGGTHPWAGGLQAKAEEPTTPGAQYSASTAMLDFFDGLSSVPPTEVP
jgi:polyhydroxybutyrate depolymerase